MGNGNETKTITSDDNNNFGEGRQERNKNIHKGNAQRPILLPVFSVVYRLIGFLCFSVSLIHLIHEYVTFGWIDID